MYATFNYQLLLPLFYMRNKAAHTIGFSLLVGLIHIMMAALLNLLMLGVCGSDTSLLYTPHVLRSLSVLTTTTERLLPF